MVASVMKFSRDWFGSYTDFIMFFQYIIKLLKMSVVADDTHSENDSGFGMQ